MPTETPHKISVLSYTAPRNPKNDLQMLSRVNGLRGQPEPRSMELLHKPKVIDVLGLRGEMHQPATTPPSGLQADRLS